MKKKQEKEKEHPALITDICITRDELGLAQAFQVFAHRIYAKKARRHEDIGGIILSDKMRENTNRYTVCAIGPECGKYRKVSKKVKAGFDGLHCGIVNPVKCGDDVLLPHAHWSRPNHGKSGRKIAYYGLREHEEIVDESAIIAIVKGGNDIQPVGTWTLLKPDQEREAMKCGLHIADIDQFRTMYCTVVRTGTGRIKKNGTIIPNQVKDGDYVVTTITAGEDIFIDNIRHRLIREEDIQGLVAKTKTA